MYPIVLWPDPILQNKTEEVTVFDEKLHDKISEMLKVMREMGGVGLAANQIGYKDRIAIIEKDDKTELELINPSMVFLEPKENLEESCLSVVDIAEKIPRSSKIYVSYQDRNGNSHEENFSGRMAHIIQHEVDHLDGKVFLDYLSQLRRDIARRKMIKMQKIVKKLKEAYMIDKVIDEMKPSEEQ